MAATGANPKDHLNTLPSTPLALSAAFEHAGFREDATVVWIVRCSSVIDLSTLRYPFILLDKLVRS